LTDLVRGPVPQAVWDGAAEAMGDDDLTGLVLTVTGINAWNRVMIAAGEEPPPV